MEPSNKVLSVMYVTTKVSPDLEDSFKRNNIEITVVSSIKVAQELIDSGRKFTAIVIDSFVGEETPTPLLDKVSNGSQMATKWLDRGMEVILLFDSIRNWYTNLPAFSKCSLSTQAYRISSLIIGLSQVKKK